MVSLLFQVGLDHPDSKFWSGLFLKSICNDVTVCRIWFWGLQDVGHIQNSRWRLLCIMSRRSTFPCIGTFVLVVTDLQTIPTRHCCNMPRSAYGNLFFIRESLQYSASKYRVIISLAVVTRASDTLKNGKEKP